MATLVFSTIGTALGGPIGSAVGALIGQSIDQQLLAPVRRGPRVGDLGVQTSSYGTQIPRIFGTMRVAGSVIWSTDLIERSSASGAKGQPDVTYSYSVSFAVALSSRRVRAIKRIWADGKLLRGAAGDFKIGTKFRFYAGDEDQEIDPLIGSSEGIALTPAFRGLTVCVFEDLELAEFGNRIPFLTFEVQADVEPLLVGNVLNEASGDLIASDSARAIDGYAAYGRSIRAALDPLIDSLGINLFDDGNELRSAASEAGLPVASDDLGNSADGKAVGLFEREQVSNRSLPAWLRLTYYDASRDYQTSEARSSVGAPGSEMQQDLACVLSAMAAKGIANEMLARAWARRDRLTLRLPIALMSCEPGTILTLPFVPEKWQVQSVTIEAFVTILELRPMTSFAASMVADSGRLAANPDALVGEVALALFDVPNPAGVSSVPTLLLAASSAGTAWKPRPVELQIGERLETTQTARGKSLLGRAVGSLGVGDPYLVDEGSNVEVQLIDHDQWLTSSDADALADGANLAILGNELIQFGIADPLGEGRFRLSRLLRGRVGTEWACGTHAPGELFCVLQVGSLQLVNLIPANIGASVRALAGDADTSILLGGETLRPLAPVGLSAEVRASGDVTVRWTRRSRAGLTWIDGVDAPLGETREQYRVVIASTTESIEFSTAEPAAQIEAATMVQLGAGPISVAVQQIGDYAASRPAEVIIA